MGDNPILKWKCSSTLNVAAVLHLHSLTATKVQSNFMDSINVNDDKVIGHQGMWVVTAGTGRMAQLYAQTKCLEFDALKKRAVPLLCNTYLNHMQWVAFMAVNNAIMAEHLHPKAVPTVVLESITATVAVHSLGFMTTALQGDGLIKEGLTFWEPDKERIIL
ncbi:uncharacterized protein BJ212DRAFT_1303886 [Suillus subaureus]|uniref:Uncharacterized protein n=1 Tax=Suillus subaureus TaxID=48587 RepID=A0A9P7DXR2_9AGAM|nr:uncharacterized protein BJ212DRAFT_1303886 [Suillus subaureus]KAG1805819.1 hypothetical protein BJ212DRAFT_1303886 [Suillus subaureus]